MSDPRSAAAERIQALTRGQKGDKGAQGNQGNRGEQGEQGLSRRTRGAVVYLFFAAVLLAALALFGVLHSSQVTRASQQKQDQVVERKLCTTLAKLTALRPPPGNPETNPSRKFDQDLHATLAQLGPDIGCR